MSPPTRKAGARPPPHAVTEREYKFIQDCVERRVGRVPPLCDWVVCEHKREHAGVEWHIPADAWALPVRPRAPALQRPSPPAAHTPESVAAALDKLLLTPEQKRAWHEHAGRGMYG